MSIPIIKLKEPETCPICYEEMRFSAETPCDHTFHEKCIANWLSTKNTCPLCREDI